MAVARTLRSVAFDDRSDSVVIEYMTPSQDVKLNGVCLNHAVMVPATDEFRDLLLTLHDACQKALAEALGAFANADAVDIEDVLDDDEPGPYDHPDDGGQG